MTVYDDITSWADHRRTISEGEENEPVSPSVWERSDDEAVELLRDAADLLALTQGALYTLRDALYDQAAAFTCSEVDVIVHLYREFGYWSVADDLLEAHAENDEPGDDHYPDEA